MNAEEFNEFLEETLERTRKVLAAKGDEYVPGTEEVSRFHNFQIGAHLNQQHIEQVLWGFVTKHIVSLSDMVKTPPSDHSLEAWDEKIGDVINYMILLKAMVTYDAKITEGVREFVEGMGDISEHQESDNDPPTSGASVLDFALHTDPVNPNTDVVETKSTTIDKRPALNIHIEGDLPRDSLTARREHAIWMQKNTPPQHN